jgi:hypothetical protein
LKEQKYFTRKLQKVNRFPMNSRREEAPPAFRPGYSRPKHSPDLDKLPEAYYGKAKTGRIVRL